MIDLELMEFKNICMDMAELGVASYAKSIAPMVDAMSQRDAYRVFGEVQVKRWVRENKVKVFRNGASLNSKKLYSRTELMAVRQAEKLNQIFNR